MQVLVALEVLMLICWSIGFISDHILIISKIDDTNIKKNPELPSYLKGLVVEKENLPEYKISDYSDFDWDRFGESEFHVDDFEAFDFEEDDLDYFGEDSFDDQNIVGNLDFEDDEFGSLMGMNDFKEEDLWFDESNEGLNIKFFYNGLNLEYPAEETMTLQELTDMAIELFQITISKDCVRLRDYLFDK